MPPVSTLSDPFFTLEQPDPSGAMVWRNLASLGKPTEIGAIVDMSLIPDPSREPAPTQDECARMKEEEWYKTFKRGSIGRDWSGFFADETPIEDRDSTLLSWLGGLVDHIYGSPYEGTPRRAYAVLYAAVEQMDPNKGGQPRDWLAWAWEKIGWAWQRRVARDQSTPKSNQQVAREEQPPVTSLLPSVALKMREWCNEPDLEDPNSEAAMQFVKRLAVVCVRNKSYYTLRRDTGCFHNVGLTLEHVRNELIRSGLAGAFTLEKETNDGGMTPIGDRELLAQLMPLHIRAVEGEGGLTGDQLRNITRDSATYVKSLYRLRTDITPAFSQDVHDLMLAQVGPDALRIYEAWIAHALDFSRGICMIALLGPPRTGKSFMALGLADCLEIRSCGVASGPDLMTDFPPLLQHTPFVEIAEALPVNAHKAQARDTLRQLIGGASLQVNIKGQPHMTVRSPLRVMVTTNNDSPIRQLANDDASPDDVGAIMERTLVLRVQDAAAAWLDERGGFDLTRRWVSAGGKQASDWTLAKHFLYLYERREDYADLRGSRFWIAGNGLGKDEETEAALSESEAYVEVMSAVCDLLEMPNKESLKAISLDGGIWMTAGGVLSFMQTQRVSTKLSLKMIGNQFAAFGSKKAKNATRACTSGEKQVQNWWPIDAAKLRAFAIRYGKPHNFLDVRVGNLETPSALHPAT